MSLLWNISLRCQQRSLSSFGLGEERTSGPFPLQPPTQGGQSRQPHSLPPSPRSPGGCCRLSSIAGSSGGRGGGQSTWSLQLAVRMENKAQELGFLTPQETGTCPWLSPAGPSRVLPRGLDPAAGTHLAQAGLGWEQGTPPPAPGPPAGGLRCMLPSSRPCPPVCPEQGSGS